VRLRAEAGFPRRPLCGLGRSPRGGKCSGCWEGGNQRRRTLRGKKRRWE